MVCTLNNIASFAATSDFDTDREHRSSRMLSIVRELALLIHDV